MLDNSASKSCDRSLDRLLRNAARVVSSPALDDFTMPYIGIENVNFLKHLFIYLVDIRGKLAFNKNLTSMVLNIHKNLFLGIIV